MSRIFIMWSRRIFKKMLSLVLYSQYFLSYSIGYWKLKIYRVSALCFRMLKIWGFPNELNSEHVCCLWISISEYLVCSLLVESALSCFRIYQIFQVTDDYGLFDLEPIIQLITCGAFGLLVLFDGICIHKVVGTLFLLFVCFL